MKKDSGLVALPTVLLISAIILEISIAGALFSTSLTNTRLNERLSAIALASARSGAEDAMIRIIRYKNCPSDPFCPASYTLTTGNVSGLDSDNGSSALITISDDGSGRITILSIGTISRRKKSVEVILLVDTTTGEVSLESFEEISV